MIIIMIIVTTFASFFVVHVHVYKLYTITPHWKVL